MAKPYVGIIASILAVVVIATVASVILTLSYSGVGTTIRNSSDSAQARAMATPIQYLDGSTSNITMCNNTANCGTISPMLSCVRTGVDTDCSKFDATACPKHHMCAVQKDGTCSLKSELDAFRGASKCSGKPSPACYDDATCRWNSGNQFCDSYFTKDTCVEPCAWSTCADFSAETPCTNGGCHWNDKRCSYNGLNKKACSENDKELVCLQNGCAWSGKTCKDPGTCGLCESRFCGTVDTHRFTVRGAADGRFDGTYEYDVTSGMLTNGSGMVLLKSAGEWQLSSAPSVAATYHTTDSHLTQDYRNWTDLSGNPMIPQPESNPISSTLCASHATAGTCTGDAACMWDIEGGECKRLFDAIEEPWCTRCDKLDICAAGSACVPDDTTNKCKAGNKYSGVCPDLITGCNIAKDCYACKDTKLCADNSTACETTDDCKKAVCQATPGVLWDSNTCKNITCWGECRIPVSSSRSVKMSCDDKLAYAFAQRMADLSSNPVYAKPEQSGRYKWTDFKGACNKACDDCPSALSAECGSCEFKTSTGSTCKETCASMS